MAGLALVFAGLFAGLWFSQDRPMPTDRQDLISKLYDPPSGALEDALNKGDGQIFALQASDPLIRRTDLFGSPVPGHHAYRWERPLYGYLGWTLSGGNPDRVPAALIVLTVLSASALVAAIAWAIEVEGGDGRFALLILISPGVLANLRHVGPESLATALAVVGVLLWTRRTGRGWVAVGCFAAAALCRETMLLVPAALALHAQFAPRDGVEGRGLFAWRPDAWRLASAALPLAAWVLLLRWRIGVWPEPSNETLIDAVPFGGLRAGNEEWGAAEVFASVLVIGPTLWLLATARRTIYAPLVYAYAGFAVFVGATMWGDDMKFGRLFLLLTAIAVISIARHASPGGGAASVDARPGREVLSQAPYAALDLEGGSGSVRSETGRGTSASTGEDLLRAPKQVAELEVRS